MNASRPATKVNFALVTGRQSGRETGGPNRRMPRSGRDHASDGVRVSIPDLRT